MMFEDKVLYTEKVEKEGEVSLATPFYVFLKSIEADNNELVVIVEGVPFINKNFTENPLNVNSWNPILFKKVKITAPILAKYNVFLGHE